MNFPLNLEELLDLFSKLKSSELHTHVILDSLKVIKKYSQFTHNKIDQILIDEKYYSQNKDEIDSLPIIHKTFFNQKDMKSLVGYVYHKGIIGIGKRSEYSDLNSLNGTTFFLNGISSPENVGNICRSLAAFNIKNLVVDKRTVDPFIRRSIRVSMGNVFTLNIFRIDSIQGLLDELYSRDFHIYGADRREFSKDIHTVNTQAQKNIGIIIGSEGHGIDPKLYPLLTGVIHIPINHDVGYLNAANAASILAYYFRSHL